MWRELLNAAVGLVEKIPGAKKLLSRIAINKIIKSTPPRPHPFSLWSADKVGPADIEKGAAVESARYTSWRGLVDRDYTGRHLPPAAKAYTDGLPHLDRLKELFVRDTFKPAPKTSVLFPFFAQWFTDSFLRTNPVDRRKNTSNHEIDLCQIYGLKESTSDILRTRDGSGNLRYELINGDQYGEKLYRQDIDGLEVKDRFKDLPYVKLGVLPRVLERGNFDLKRLKDFYASGLERGNTTIGYSAVSTIFRREHNRLCAEMKSRNPRWDDDRLFQTARNVNITLLLKLIVEEYVNHLANAPVKLLVEVGFADKQQWYRTNRIAIEFDLLYRWHGLVPDTFELGGETYDDRSFRYNNPLLERHGAEEVIKAASRQHAGKLVLNNSPKFLEEAEWGAINLARQFHVRSYTEYCKAFNQRVPRSFLELTGNQNLAEKLKALYGGVEKVEFVIGLLAEKRSEADVLGPLMQVMVGVDAFSQALTNPLLSQNVFGADTFSEYGLKTISETQRFQDIVKRNCGSYNPNDVVASFDVVT
ncbi:MAG: hypothetical protein IIA68_00160 [Proteobacteria bacterium]|nr:hypothetical protein [Pseudomonadota bacterium]